MLSTKTILVMKKYNILQLIFNVFVLSVLKIEIYLSNYTNGWSNKSKTVYKNNQNLFSQR